MRQRHWLGRPQICCAVLSLGLGLLEIYRTMIGSLGSGRVSQMGESRHKWYLWNPAGFYSAEQCNLKYTQGYQALSGFCLQALILVTVDLSRASYPPSLGSMCVH